MHGVITTEKTLRFSLAPKKAEMFFLLRLAFPLMFSGFVGNGIGFFSTYFSAHLGVAELAASTLSMWIYSAIMMVIWGTICSVSIVVAQKHGAKDKDGIALTLSSGLFLAFMCSIVGFAVVWNMAYILFLSGQPKEVVTLSNTYFHAFAWGLFPDFVGLVLIQFLMGLGHTKTNMIFTFIWAPMTIVFNWLLVYGEYGFFKLGIAGIGWGTTLAYWITTSGLILYMLASAQYRPYLNKMVFLKSPTLVKDLFVIGLPIGVMYCSELFGYLGLTLLMGYLGNDLLISNQVVLQFINQTMPIIFSIGQAVSIRVGHKIGANQQHEITKIVYIGLAISFFSMIVVTQAYYFFSDELVSFDFEGNSKDALVVMILAKPLFVMGAVFQIIESIRLVLYSALRSFKDTFFTMVISLSCFWGVGLPISYLFGIYIKTSGQGLWMGLIIGAGLNTAFLFWRFCFLTRLKNDQGMPDCLDLRKSLLCP
ncbi:MAG: MATE family efflux transporter [Gammaproteobacteria bacterium]|nr:MATE family efflux transporter [Gammaproteobacteria bacterium]